MSFWEMVNFCMGLLTPIVGLGVVCGGLFCTIVVVWAVCCKVWEFVCDAL